MWIAIWNKTTKVIRIVAVTSERSYDLRDGETLIDDTGDGFLDTIAMVRSFTAEEGWANYNIKVEGRL